MNAMKEISAMKWVIAYLFAIVAIAGGQTQTVGARQTMNPNPELVSKLTNELNITPKQAVGGAGAIFGLARSRLSPADFSQVAAAVPGMNGFLKAAPTANEGSGLSSSLGSLGSVAPGGAGGIGSLASSFQSLKLSPAMASKFMPVLENYIGSKGGPKVAALLGGVLK